MCLASSLTSREQANDTAIGAQSNTGAAHTEGDETDVGEQVRRGEKDVLLKLQRRSPKNASASRTPFLAHKMSSFVVET